MAEVQHGRSKPFAPLRVQLQILIGGTLVLLFGLLVAPRTTRPPRPPESPTPILTEQARTFEATALVQRVAGAATPFTVVLPAEPVRAFPGSLDDWRLLPNPPAPHTVHAGLVVSPEGDVLTAAAGLSRVEDIPVRLATGRLLASRVRVFDPVTGLAILRLEGLGPFSSAPLAATPPAPGETVVAAVATTSGDVVASALVVAARPDRLVFSGLPAGLARGLPLFATNGEAVAVVGSPGQGASTALLIPAFLERADQLVAQGLAIPSASGLSLQALEGALIHEFGEPGVLISEVVPGSPAEEAGLRAGDVLLRLADTLVSTPEEASQQLASLTPGSEVAVVIRREGGELTMGLTPDRLVNARWLDHRPVALTDAPTAAELAMPGQLSVAGVPPHARIRLVNGSPPTRRMRRPATGLIYAEVDGRPFYAVLPEPAR